MIKQFPHRSISFMLSALLFLNTRLLKVLKCVMSKSSTRFNKDTHELHTLFSFHRLQMLISHVHLVSYVFKKTFQMSNHELSFSRDLCSMVFHLKLIQPILTFVGFFTLSAVCLHLCVPFTGANGCRGLYL